MMPTESSFRDYIPLFDVFNEAIIIYNSERIQWVNKALVSLMGYDSREEIIGKSILSLVDIESKQEATHQLKRLYEGVKRTGGVYNAIRKDGSTVSVVSRGSQLPGDESLLVSIVRPTEEDPIEGSNLMTDFRVKHEISSSLTVIKGYVEMLQEKTIDCSGDFDKWFSSIYQNLEKIEKILF